MAQPKSNLGRKLREARLAKNYTLREVGSLTKHVPSFHSKLELGDVAGGASNKVLKKLSDILDVPLDELMRLRDEDEGVTEAKDEEGVSLSDAEKRLLGYFRTSDEPLQIFLVEQARLSNETLNQTGTDVLVSMLRRKTKGESRTRIDDSFRQQAYLWEKIARDLMRLPLFSEALTAYRQAEMIYKQINDQGALARLHYVVGYAYLSFDDNFRDEVADRIGNLRRAINCFNQAQHELNALPDATAEQRDRLPENLSKWAQAEIRLAEILQEADAEGISKVAQEEVKALKNAAEAKQNQAIDLLNGTITDLNRERRNTRVTQSLPNENYAKRLFDAHVRLAEVQATIAADEGKDSQDADQQQNSEPQHRLGRKAYQQSKENMSEAIKEVREYALKTGDAEGRNWALHQLSYAHAELGRIVLKTGEPMEATPMEAKKIAAFNYAIADNIVKLIVKSHDLRHSEHIERSLAEIEDDLSREDSKALKEAVNVMLEGAELGTLDKLHLKYDSTYSDFGHIQS